MASDLAAFEQIVRRAHRHTDVVDRGSAAHPFDARDVHADLPPDVRALFDNGHYAQATFEAFKFVDEEVQRVSGNPDFGKSLMMRVFGGTPPQLPLNEAATLTDQSEQEGFKFLFAGGVMAIRNPRGHKSGLADDPDTCLDHLSFASMLLRKLDSASLR